MYSVPAARRDLRLILLWEEGEVGQDPQQPVDCSSQGVRAWAQRTATVSRVAGS